MKIQIFFVALIFSFILVNYVNGNDLPNDFCRDISFGVFPHPDNCTLFVVCMNGQPTVNQCPVESPIFVNGSCEQDNPEECDDQTTTPVVTDDPTDITTTSGPPDDFCEGITVGTFPHPNNCFQFIFCVFGVMTIQSCPENEIFYNNTCVYGDLETCEVFVKTTETVSTTSQESEFPTATYSDDIESSTIDFTESSTIQEFTTTTSILRTTTSASAPIHRCPPGGNGIIPNYANCSRYFECINGIRHMRFCPKDLLFDSVTLDCTSPELAVCAGTNLGFNWI